MRPTTTFYNYFQKNIKTAIIVLVITNNRNTNKNNSNINNIKLSHFPATLDTQSRYLKMSFKSYISLFNNTSLMFHGSSIHNWFSISTSGLLLTVTLHLLYGVNLLINLLINIISFKGIVELTAVSGEAIAITNVLFQHWYSNLDFLW